VFDAAAESRRSGEAAEADEAASHKLLDDYFAWGGNFIDTADVYSAGKSEEIIGRWLKTHPDEMKQAVIATKGRFTMGPGPNDIGLSRKHLNQALNASLRRLDIEHVDLYQMHAWDALTPIEESMRGLEDLVRAGKVIYPAVSNWSAWQTQRAVDLQERNNWARLQVTQPMYSLVKRQAEVEILPMAEANGIGVIPYSPAGAGLLSGKYFGNATGRLRSNKMYEARYGEPWMHEIAAKFVAFCRGRGLHPVGAAVAWVATHPAITAPIIGARNIDQLQASLDSVKIEMSPALRAEITALSRTPPPATDRSEEQRK